MLIVGITISATVVNHQAAGPIHRPGQYTGPANVPVGPTETVQTAELKWLMKIK